MVAEDNAVHEGVTEDDNDISKHVDNNNNGIDEENL